MKHIVESAIILLALMQSCSALDDYAHAKAAEYKSFDELIDKITELEYNNRTYYIVSYTKTLQPSGSLLVDSQSGAVEDLAVIRVFSKAQLIHQNYPPESVGQWMQFSEYFTTMSGAFAQSNPGISNDSRKIGGLLAYSAVYLNGSIAHLSPDYTEKYLAYDRQAIDYMAEAYERTPEKTGSAYIKDYRDSLKNIRMILINNMEGIETGGEYMAELMHERVVSERNRPSADIYTVGAAIAVLLFLFLVVKRSNKGKQPQ